MSTGLFHPREHIEPLAAVLGYPGTLARSFEDLGAAVKQQQQQRQQRKAMIRERLSLSAAASVAFPAGAWPTTGAGGLPGEAGASSMSNIAAASLLQAGDPTEPSAAARSDVAVGPARQASASPAMSAPALAASTPLASQRPQGSATSTVESDPSPAGGGVGTSGPVAPTASGEDENTINSSGANHQQRQRTAATRSLEASGLHQSTASGGGASANAAREQGDAAVGDEAAGAGKLSSCWYSLGLFTRAVEMAIEKGEAESRGTLENVLASLRAVIATESAVPSVILLGKCDAALRELRSAFSLAPESEAGGGGGGAGGDVLARAAAGGDNSSSEDTDGGGGAAGGEADEISGQDMASGQSVARTSAFCCR